MSDSNPKLGAAVAGIFTASALFGAAPAHAVPDVPDSREQCASVAKLLRHRWVVEPVVEAEGP